MGASEIMPISMSVDSDLLHRHLRGYKDDRSLQVRSRMTRRLAALIAVFMRNHATCVGPFDTLALVPSAARVALEPVINLIPTLREAYTPSLEAIPGFSKADLSTDRFRLLRQVDGERVLLMDDTFASGATLFSAAATLRGAGAEIVGPIVLGRHLRPSWPPSSELLAWLRQRTWDETRCCRCDGERENPGTLI